MSVVLHYLSMDVPRVLILVIVRIVYQIMIMDQMESVVFLLIFMAVYIVQESVFVPNARRVSIYQMDGVMNVQLDV